MKKVKSIVSIILAMVLTASIAYAEVDTAYVLCNPQSIVNVHFSARKGNNVIAYVKCGDEITVDGQKKGEWVHIVDNWCDNDAWIHEGYVSYSYVYVETWDAVGYKKVRIRNRINGKIIGTLKKGAPVTVYAFAENGWAYTSRGYIMSQFLDDGLGGI